MVEINRINVYLPNTYVDTKNVKAPDNPRQVGPKLQIKDFQITTGF